MTRATEDRIYFDHNATAPLRPEAKAAMLAAMEQVGNPSSVHAEGRRARAIVERAREQVAGLVGAKPSEVVFTSGATESNNWVLRAGWDAIVVAGIEHDSVLAPARASGSRIVEIGTHSDGIVDTCAIADHVLLGNGPLGRDLVTLQMANSETGVLQDVGAVSDFCAAHGVAMHTDAVQAPGRVPIDFAGLGVTFLSLSAHKLGGPKGIGALIIRDGVELPGGFAGGGQELRRRAGTENVTAIAGFGAAAEAAQRDLDDVARVAEMRDRLQREMVEIVPETVVLGASSERLPNTLAVALPGQRAETLVIKFDMAGIAISAGSACSSGKVGPSEAMRAMGLPKGLADGAIRISLGWSTSNASLEPFLIAWRDIAGRVGARNTDEGARRQQAAMV
jgi:cysteine desulfurase